MLLAGMVKELPEKAMDTMEDILEAKIPIYMYSTIPMEESDYLDNVRKEILYKAMMKDTIVKNIFSTITDVMENNGAIFEPSRERPPWPNHRTKTVGVLINNILFFTKFS